MKNSPNRIQAAPPRQPPPPASTRTEWCQTLQRYEKALGGRASLCHTLGGLPDAVYNAWKSGEIPPEWIQLIICEFLDSELGPAENPAHPFE